MPIPYKTPQAKRGGSDVVWACTVMAYSRRARPGRLAALAAPPLMQRWRRGASRGRGGRGGTRAGAGRASLRTCGLSFASGRFPVSLSLADSAPLRYVQPAHCYAPPAPRPQLAPAARPCRMLRPAPPPLPAKGGAASAASLPVRARRLHICHGAFTFVMFVVSICTVIFTYVMFVVSICTGSALHLSLHICTCQFFILHL